MVEACARRNRRQDVSVARSGAGGIRRSLRILRMVDAPTRWPSLRSFALDALVAPGLVLSGHPFDQRGDRRIDGWAAGAVRVGPPLGHGQAPDQRGEQGSVGPVQARLGVDSAEYGD